MKDLIEKQEEFKIYLEEELSSGEKRWERIAFLVKCNGGFEVHGWGTTTYGGVHQEGLEQMQAIELLAWEAQFNGIAGWSDINPFEIFLPYFKEYCEGFEIKPAKEEYKC